MIIMGFIFPVLLLLVFCFAFAPKDNYFGACLLFIMALLLAIMSMFSIAYDFGYKHADIAIQNGEAFKYELVKESDGSSEWKEKSTVESN